MWSVRSCEGSLKKRGHCLIVNGLDAQALVAPVSISGKLSVRRTPPDQLATQTQPRAVLRVANRGNDRVNHRENHREVRDITRENARGPAAHDLEPFLQDLQNDVARLSRAFATLGREANALVRSEAEMRARIENRQNTGANERTSTSSEGESPPVIQNNEDESGNERMQLSRNARRRMRQRLRAALNGNLPPVPAPRVTNHFPGTQRQNGPTSNNNIQRNLSGVARMQQPPVPPPVAPPVAPPPVPPPPVGPQSSQGQSNGLPQEGNARVTRRKRRHRR